jgi:hypothetical protein
VKAVGDILFQLGISAPKKNPANYAMNKYEEKIFRLIKTGLDTQEGLALASKLDGSTVSSALTGLEIIRRGSTPR